MPSYCFFYWDNNCVIFLFHFLPANPLLYPSLLSFRFVASFHEMLFHAYMCTYVFLNRTCSVCVMLLVSLLQGIWYWVSSWCARPQRELLLLLPASLVAHSLCPGLKPPSFPSTVACLLVPVLFGSCLGSHVGESLCVYLLTFLWDTLSQQNLYFSDS